MADPIANNPPNPQVESTASSQVSNVSTAALLQSNPALGKEYSDYLVQQQQALIAAKTKEAADTWGGEQNLTVDQINEIRAEAVTEAVAASNAKYKDQIIAAKAGTVTQTGTPPPSNPDSTVSSTTNPQVAQPATSPVTPPVTKSPADAAVDAELAAMAAETARIQAVADSNRTTSAAAVSSTENPQVPADTGKIADFSYSTLVLADPTTAKALITEQRAIQQELANQQVAEYRAVTGTAPGTPLPDEEVARITTETAAASKAQVQARYKDQIVAAGAATSVPADTPPPSPTAPAVSPEDNPQTPSPLLGGVVNGRNVPPGVDILVDPQTGEVLGTLDPIDVALAANGVTAEYDPQVPQISTAVAAPPTPAPAPPSPSPYERFIASEAAATDAAQIEANKNFQAQIDALNDPQAPQAIPVEDATNLEAVPLDNNATDYGEFLGNGTEPAFVDYGQELGNGDTTSYDNFYGNDAGEFQDLATEPAAADPVDYGDFIGGNGEDITFVDYGQELGNGDGKSAGFGDFFNGADAAVGGALANALKSAAAVNGITDPQSGALQKFNADSASGISAGNTKTPSQLAAERQAAAVAQAKAQAEVNAQRKQANDGDWRVKIRLAGGSDYLYNAPTPGILKPLKTAGGVIFPYTPQITTQYTARYSNYELTHSNYKGYFYQGSNVGEVNINATFTAQDTSEAEYLLAVIHFFRSVTKMFYGQDDASKRGAPPPLVFLQGLGEYQFNLSPCVVASFNYTLPADVDYIRAYSPNYNGTNLLQRRDRQDLPTSSLSSANSRLSNAGLTKGGINTPPAPPTLGINSPTYVPTKMEIQLVLLPVQTRSQVSQQFSLKQFANGDLVRGGFW